MLKRDGLFAALAQLFIEDVQGFQMDMFSFKAMDS